MLQRFNPGESNTFNSSFLRRYARHMLHAAHSDRTSVALPVLRRIHAMEIVPAVSRFQTYVPHAGQGIGLYGVG